MRIMLIFILEFNTQNSEGFTSFFLFLVKSIISFLKFFNQLEIKNQNILKLIHWKIC